MILARMAGGAKTSILGWTTRSTVDRRGAGRAEGEAVGVEVIQRSARALVPALCLVQNDRSTFLTIASDAPTRS